MVRTIVLAVAATLAASAVASAETYYTLSNPRIIHVPQPGDDARRSQASLHSNAPEEFDDDDAEAAQPQRPHRVVPPKPQRRSQPVAQSKTKPKRNAVQESPPRRKPFSVSLPEPPPPPEPEPAGPRRALLSAPPPPPTSSLHDGPTPLRPTPRFGEPLPKAPAPLTTFTPAPPVAALKPPPLPASEPPQATASVPEFAAQPLPAGDNDDDLPPPGDPKLAPPEPRD